MAKKFSTLLYMAAREIDRRGLAKGALIEVPYGTSSPFVLELGQKYPNAPICALGAIAIVVKEETYRDYMLRRYLHRAIDANSPNSPYKFATISGWNDRPERTKKEVINTFKNAARLAKSEGR